MNLVIDKGNTQTKAAIFDKNGEMLFVSKNKDLPAATIQKYKVENCITCNVSGEKIDIDKNLFNYFITFSHKTPVPIINKYQTPETLGLDRLAAAIAANQQFSQNNCLIIDAGTCITYDIITQKKEYLGGAISPGINMRFKAMNKQTGKLPLLKYNETDIPPLIGSDTNGSIFSGVINGILLEMKGFIKEFENNFSDLKIILTGGDSQIFEMQLKNHIFADPNLLLKGLNGVLNYNIEIDNK